MARVAPKRGYFHLLPRFFNESNLTERLNMSEVWEDVVGYEGLYRVSNIGRVKTIKNGQDRLRVLIDNRNRGGCYSVKLYNKNRVKDIKVHRLVLTAFEGQCPIGKEGSHLDGNPKNNNISNLKWESHSDNCSRKITHGTQPRGENMTQSKLTENRVRIIKNQLALKSISQTEIARMHSISVQSITDIKKNRTWRHI